MVARKTSGGVEMLWEMEDGQDTSRVPVVSVIVGIVGRNKYQEYDGSHKLSLRRASIL